MSDLESWGVVGVVLMGEVAGVNLRPEGVGVRALSRSSKLDRLDDGLVVNRDGVNLAENGVRSSVIMGSVSVAGCFREKRPKLSLVCPFFVVASIASRTSESCRVA